MNAHDNRTSSDSHDIHAQAWNAAVEKELRSGGRAPNPGPAPWVQRFNQFIAQTYSNAVKTGGACEGGPTLAEAQKRLDEIIQYEQRLIDAIPVGQAKGKVVATGWKYTPNPNGAPPSPTSQPVAAAPAANAPGTITFFCLTPLSPQRVIYFSPVAPRIATVTQGDLNASFAAHLATKYGFKTSVSCNDNSRNLQDARPLRQQQIESYRAGGYTVVETDWTYTPAAGAPEIPAPARGPSPAAPVASAAANPPPRASNPPASSAVAPAPAAPLTLYTFCWGQLAGRAPTFYFSAQFEAPARNIQAWQAAYREFLVNKYQFAGAIQCGGSIKPLAESQQAADAVRATKKGPIIETGWKFE